MTGGATPVRGRPFAAGPCGSWTSTGSSGCRASPSATCAGAIDGLRSRGARVVFATNNSAPTTDELLARLERSVSPPTPTTWSRSAGAAASLLEPGQSVRVLGEAGLLEALEARGVGSPTAAARRRGGRVEPHLRLRLAWPPSLRWPAPTGRLIATNERPDPPHPEGLLPGSGALLAAVATASGVDPGMAGKPHAPMVECIRNPFGPAGAGLGGGGRGPAGHRRHASPNGSASPSAWWTRGDPSGDRRRRRAGGRPRRGLRVPGRRLAERR